MFNEAENAAILLQEIHDALETRMEYEVIVVDDGSTDNTLEVLLGLQADMPRLRVILHGKNSGQSASIITGVRMATAPWIATLDGDGQNDPADIPALFEKTLDIDPELTPLLIAGNRRKRNDNWLRRMSSRIANNVRSSLLNDGCMDTGCGLKIFPRNVFMTLPHFNHIHRFLPALFQRAHCTVTNVPVNHRPRLRGQSKYGVWNRLWVGIVDILGVRWLQRRGGIYSADCQPVEKLSSTTSTVEKSVQ
jgi:dolichol-phosphate mannosyltransferase